MKQKILTNIAIILWVILLSLFAPLLKTSDNLFSFLDLLKNPGFIIIYSVFAIVFVINIISFILQFIVKIKSKNIHYLSIIFLLTGSFYFMAPILFKKINNTFQIANGGIVLSLTLLILFIYGLSFLFNNLKFSAKDMSEIAVYIALAIILDLPIFKIKVVASGGSISFTMVPLVILALRKDFLKSFIGIGIIYSLITCMFDGYGFVSFPFDYLLGFGSLSVISLFRKLIYCDESKFKTPFKISILISAILLGCVLRTFFSMISGILIYGLKPIPSLIYQLTYIGPSTAIVIGVMLILYKPLLHVHQKYDI